MDEKLKAEITELLQNLQFQDSIELGDAKGRIKVYVNFGDEVKAKEKISNAIRLLKEKKAEVLEWNQRKTKSVIFVSLEQSIQ